MSIDWRMKRTAPSPNRKLAPPLWLDLNPKDRFQLFGAPFNGSLPFVPSDRWLMGTIVLQWDAPPLKCHQMFCATWSWCFGRVSPTAIVLDKPSDTEAKLISVPDQRLKRPRMYRASK